MNAKTNPTARPWQARHWTCHANTSIMSISKQPVAETSGLGNDIDLCEANAALIVKAVNEYDALLAAAEALEKLMDAAHWTPTNNWNIGPMDSSKGGKIDMARTALANLAAVRGQKVEGGK